MNAMSSTLFSSTAKLLATALLFMMLGTGIELFLLDHYEDLYQLIPILSIGFSLVVFLLLLIKKTPFLYRTFSVLMLFSALSGVLGVYLHLEENFEFEQEMTPTASDWSLFVESFSGALPALAPGSMIALALIGYSYIKLIKSNP